MYTMMNFTCRYPALERQNILTVDNNNMSGWNVIVSYMIHKPLSLVVLNLVLFKVILSSV